MFAENCQKVMLQQVWWMRPVAVSRHLGRVTGSTATRPHMYVILALVCFDGGGDWVRGPGAKYTQ